MDRETVFTNPMDFNKMPVATDNDSVDTISVYGSEQAVDMGVRCEVQIFSCDFSLFYTKCSPFPVNRSVIQLPGTHLVYPNLIR